MTEVELALTAALRAEGMVGITAILDGGIGYITVYLYDIGGKYLTRCRINSELHLHDEDDVRLTAHRIKQHLLAWAAEHTNRRLT